MDSGLKIHIFILEDDKIQADTLEKYIMEYRNDIIPVIAHSEKEAFEKLNCNDKFAIFFLDISIDGNNNNTSGMKVARYIIDNFANNAPIIFITAHPDYVLSAINNIHCTAYLLKPYTKKELYTQLDNIFITKDCLSIKTLNNVYTRINFNEIYYIESLGRYIYFHTFHGIIKSRQYRLKELIDILPAYFEKCHKSYIINSKHVHDIFPNEHYLKMNAIEDIIPCSRNYKYDIFKSENE